MVPLSAHPFGRPGPGALARPHRRGLRGERGPGGGSAADAARAGDHRPSSTVLVTSGPDRAFRIDVDDAMRIEPVAPAAAGEGDLHLPAEAALRLMYGRLDDDHRPPVDRNELPPLDRLRRVFTGF